MNDTEEDPFLCCKTTYLASATAGTLTLWDDKQKKEDVSESRNG